MRIEEKLKELGIKRILVVDDTPENLNAAEKYFLTLEGIIVEYANSAKSAIEKIQENPYDFVITDLTMEEEFSGIAVAEEAVRQGIFPVLATSYAGVGRHGPTTRVLPANDTEDIVDGTIVPYEIHKSQEAAWEKILKHSLGTYEPSKKWIDEMREYREKKGKLPEEYVEIICECLCITERTLNVFFLHRK